MSSESLKKVIGDRSLHDVFQEFGGAKWKFSGCVSAQVGDEG
jgi:hypothetical protein